MSQNVNGLRLEDLEIKPHLLTKLKGAGIDSIFDLAISIPHQLIEDGGILTGADAQIALELVMKAKTALIDSGLLSKDFSSAAEILERRKNLLKCTTGSSNLDSFLKGGGLGEGQRQRKTARGIYSRITITTTLRETVNVYESSLDEKTWQYPQKLE